MTIQELWKEGNRILTDAGLEEATLDARYLLEWVLHQDYTYIWMNLSGTVDPDVIEAYRHAVTRRKNHTPLQYITGEQEFMGCSFLVNEHVLIPRQDTECLVEAVYRHLTGTDDLGSGEIRILDLCCGSGCIGISLWKLLERGTATDRWKICLSDISSQALQVAQDNAKRLKAKVELTESDLFAGIEGRFHLIVSNPPYIPSGVIDSLMPEVRDAEPRLALDGEADGLGFYRRIVRQAGDYLDENGYLFFEIGCEQAADVRTFLEAAGFERIAVMKDFAGLDRIICGRLKSRHRKGQEEDHV